MVSASLPHVDVPLKSIQGLLNLKECDGFLDESTTLCGLNSLAVRSGVDIVGTHVGCLASGLRRRGDAQDFSKSRITELLGSLSVANKGTNKIPKSARNSTTDIINYVKCTTRCRYWILLEAQHVV